MTTDIALQYRAGAPLVTRGNAASAKPAWTRLIHRNAASIGEAGVRQSTAAHVGTTPAAAVLPRGERSDVPRRERAGIATALLLASWAGMQVALAIALLAPVRSDGAARTAVLTTITAAPLPKVVDAKIDGHRASSGAIEASGRSR